MKVSMLVIQKFVSLSPPPPSFSLSLEDQHSPVSFAIIKINLEDCAVWKEHSISKAKPIKSKTARWKRNEKRFSIDVHFNNRPGCDAQRSPSLFLREKRRVAIFINMNKRGKCSHVAHVACHADFHWLFQCLSKACIYRGYAKLALHISVSSLLWYLLTSSWQCI